MSERNSNTVRPPRRMGPGGHGPMGMMPGEKAKDFKGSIGKLVNYMGKYKFATIAG